jgi:hypothetical protein
MEIKKAIQICKRQQQWRRSQGEFEEEWIDDCPVVKRMPYSPKEYGEALDALINFAEQTIQRDTFLAVLSERL